MSINLSLLSLVGHLKMASAQQRRLARLVALSQIHETVVANRAQPRILALFHAMRDDLASALPTATKSDPEPDIDALLSNPGFLAHLDTLSELLKDTHSVSLQFGYADLSHEVGRLDPRFNLQNPHVLAAVNELATRIYGINDTTRDVIRTVIQRGIENGSTFQDMAAAIQVSAAFSPSRAMTIARTEAGTAYARGAAAAMRDLDVTHVLISDGEDFDEPCASVDGTIQTIEWYEQNPKQHPRCTRAAAPATEAQ